MSSPNYLSKSPSIEFIALMASMTSLIALSIDAMLPALTLIGNDLGVIQSNHNQLIVAALILGVAVGQVLYGPLSDSLGRKPPIYFGFSLFIIGCILSTIATNFSVMLVGRVLQGLGAAAPRVVTVAMIRDQYEGSAMARVMSFVMMVFIFVPVIAPMMGQAILFVANWRAIFGTFLGLAFIILGWFTFRQSETLAPEQRLPFSLKQLISAVQEICTNRIALGYTLATGLIFASFLGYLSSTQQIFQIQYGLGAQFPLYFGVLAIFIGAGSFLNGRLVMSLGMRWMTTRAALSLSGVAICFFGVAALQEGHPPLWALMGYCMMTFFCFGILFGNLNALAIEPLGHIAGIGASVIGSLSTLISIPLGVLIGQSYNETVLPLVGGFAVFGSLSTLVIFWTERRKS